MDNISDICANCGKAEEESDKLKLCTACKLVKYCSRDCQIAHRPQHKKECRKRAAELHDIELFKQPPNPYGDCPICFLRMPSLSSGSIFNSCCGKVICSGCSNAPVYDDQGNEVDNKKCAFCRTPWPDNNIEELKKRRRKRVEVGDAVAMFYVGYFYSKGSRGYPQDYEKALELYHRAAELGYAMAYNNIGYAYMYGEGMDVDKKKAVHYWELAAIGGDVTARHNLGIRANKAGNIDRALKHHMIATRGGNSDSLEAVKELYSKGHASKEEYTKALRSYQTYLGEIKSPQRDKAAAARESYRYY